MKNPKKFKDGKVVEVSAEESKLIKERFSKHSKNRMSPRTLYDAKIHELETALADIKKTVNMLEEKLSKIE